MTKFYLTFGQDHKRKINGTVYDHNCIAEIEAVDYCAARDIAFGKFGRKWCFVYESIKDVDPNYYPRGVIPL